MLRRINAGHDFAEKQQQKNQNRNKQHELYGISACPMDHIEKETGKQEDDGDIHHIVGNQNRREQMFGIVQ